MAVVSLKERVAALEAEVADLKKQLADAKPKDWLDVVYGAFADDPTYDEAMRLGKEWRESFRPKLRKKNKRKAANGRPGHGSSKSAGQGEQRGRSKSTAKIGSDSN